jgi:hypothetical protein
MPDYTSILRRSISALPDPSPEMRDAVYQRARAALARQLTAVDPPLSAREIEAQHQDLENAVADIEAEFGEAGDADLSALAHGVIPSGHREPPAHRDRPEHADPQRDWAPLPYGDPPPGVVPVPAPAPAPAPVQVPPGATFEAEAARNGFAPPAPPRDPVVEAAAPEEDFDEEYDDDDEPGRSRLPLILGIVVLLVALGAGGWFLTRGDMLTALVGTAGQGEAEAPAPPPVPLTVPAETAPAIAEADKRADRLANGTEVPPVAPADAEPGLEPDAAIPLPNDEEGPAEPLPSEATAGLAGNEQTAALQTPEQSIVAQRAIFYYQGAAGTPGSASDGSAAWAQVTHDGEPAIQATLNLPEQRATATVTIYRNRDATLPASHLVEVQVTGKLGPTAIQRVPALVLKQTEQARGEPLVGAAVPVTGELFWIALSDEQDQIARNIRLLREGSWFDLPILFDDGTRGLLTFEKGIPGDKVFETVMAGWTPS